MIGKVKKWLGIEGVKMELILPELVHKESRKIQGKIKFSSLHAQTISSFKLALIEKYARGRKEEKLIDEYELGLIEIQKSIDVPENGEVEIQFELPFEMTTSEMDDVAAKNIFAGAAVKALKYFEGVKSEFRIEAEATIKGVALSPFDKKEIIIE